MIAPIVIEGLAASPGRTRGVARVLTTSSEFSGVRPGEILVTRFATPEVVLVFDRIRAFVTDQGGRSAHAAVVARELGIPAVVGTQLATELISDGSVIVVDGASGIVAVVDVRQSQSWRCSGRAPRRSRRCDPRS